MLQRNALWLRGGHWKPKHDDGTLVRKLLGLLASAEIQFVVVGGVAVTLHGYVRLTKDVDILIESSHDNISELLEAMKNYGEGWARELTLADFTEKEGAIRIVEEIEHSQLNNLTVMSGLAYQDLAKNAEVIQLSPHKITYASKGDLIRLKANSVREKDQLDVIALRKLREDPNAFE